MHGTWALLGNHQQGKGNCYLIWGGGAGLSTSRDIYTGQKEDRDHGISKEEKALQGKKQIAQQNRKVSPCGEKVTPYQLHVCVFLFSLSLIQLFVTPWSAAHQAPPSMGFSRQEYWSGWPFPSPGDLPNPGIEPRSPTLQADILTSEPLGKPYTMLHLSLTEMRLLRLINREF